MATWSDIPLEVLEQIVVCMDDISLLAASKLNHILNQLALQEYLRRYHLLSNDTLSVQSPHLPEEVLPALYTAFWLRITHIIYVLNPGSLFNEIHMLTVLIERTPSIKSLILSFTNFNAPGSIYEIKSGPWRILITALLEAALARRCQTISFHECIYLYRNLDIPIMDYANERKQAPLRVPLNRPGKPKTSMIKKVASWIRCRARNTKWAPLAPAPSLRYESNMRYSENPHPQPISATTDLGKPRLTTFSLHSSAVLQPAFIPSTRDVLKKNALTLREIRLINMGDVPGQFWNILFKGIHLSALQSFTYTPHIHVLQPPEMTFHILMPFLNLHPALTSLSLYGVLTPILSSVLKEHLLPNLKVLDAHPRIVTWLLRDRDQYPPLESITIASEHWSERANARYLSAGYHEFDTAISHIAVLARPIELKFKFSTEKGLEEWIKWHVRAGPRSTLTQLLNVTRLTISCNSRTSLGSLVHLLPEWFSLFPRLEYLNFVEQPDPEIVQDQIFMDAVSRACPKLKSTTVSV